MASSPGADATVAVEADVVPVELGVRDAGAPVGELVEPSGNRYLADAVLNLPDRQGS
jgi:hypothetical protein